ncbi:hypothetical protein [Paractinoplanes brasiliensis]|uniref:hypothetical protein n=1 Tax=Paractinoplanes brasiliensis TaxID=52695 RepID=UPI00141528EF|nr:hypothetical protein [Actinoplanes brasiliensis]
MTIATDAIRPAQRVNAPATLIFTARLPHLVGMPWPGGRAGLVEGHVAERRTPRPDRRA